MEKLINMEAQYIAKKLEISDSIEYLARNSAVITLKDHRENFNEKLPFSLINPSKSELRKVSDSNGVITDNHLVLKLIVNHLAKLVFPKLLT